MAKEVAHRNSMAPQPNVHPGIKGGNGKEQDGILDSLTHQVQLAERLDCFGVFKLRRKLTDSSGRFIAPTA